ncbi:hypothetical protein K9N50_13105, partial [bacterium]|nr:hypothetical protein [bacterium]
MHKPSSHSTRLVLSVLTIILAFLPITTFAQTEVSGEVSGEWTAEDSPYIVVDSTWVPEDEELRIGPGVDVLFGENIGLDVFGTLTAEGTEEDSVRFLPQNEDLTWKGIRLHTERTEHHFDYCLLQTIDRICIQVNSSQRIFVNHSNMLCSSVVIRGLLSEDAHAIYLIVTHSNLISDGAGIFLSFSRMEASDCNFYCDGLNLDSIRLERCFVSGSIDTWHSVYIDCE